MVWTFDGINQSRYEAEIVSLVATKAAAGAQEVIAAPGAGKQILVVYCRLQRTAASVAETVCLLKDDATTIDHAVLNEYTPGVVVADAASVYQMIPLTANKALNLNLSAANSVEIKVRYAILDSAAVWK